MDETTPSTNNEPPQDQSPHPFEDQDLIFVQEHIEVIIISDDEDDIESLLHVMTYGPKK